MEFGVTTARESANKRIVNGPNVCRLRKQTCLRFRRTSEGQGQGQNDRIKMNKQTVKLASKEAVDESACVGGLENCFDLPPKIERV
jgi:hypothetical protein